MADKKFPTDFTDVITIPSANDKFMITDSTAGEALKRILWSSFPFANAGFIQTELVTSGTNLLFVKPKMILETAIGTRYIVDSTSDTTIDLTGLVASTWYACCCREDTGAFSAKTIASLTSWTGVSGNQLNMYTATWDANRKYCRASDGTYYYRIFGIFKTNAVPNGITIMFYIPNISKTKIFVQRLANLAVAAGGTNIAFDTIIYDVNSEYSSPTFTSKRTIDAIVSVGIFQYTAALAGVRNTAFLLAGTLRSLTTELSLSAVFDHVLCAQGLIITNSTLTVSVSGQNGTLLGNSRNNLTIHEI